MNTNLEIQLIDNLITKILEKQDFSTEEEMNKILLKLPTKECL